ncbi:exported hypothetical protein [Vibrio nigripulchritudo SO65]|uniref:hypothetical protein n=1 Tax=Vibrio nigripulchritudo TaxID=28173 RepID=UPI0003B1B782|nr:hypothetical protein [Vibrio nigripulchritudo]CCN34753.1 exported hypothetical protein [Vibrio nigripulchritudo AM115]CCN43731.1 exported hypothetical protein [Vibrio nigripulchritudo FTn2]CCN65230.1 exported hypothetical protein [Vibrio nigripulchritudo POn4]CCN74926.1 exported hypothetical protein [Vibrio nigripulchritudo SO65]
MHIFLAMLMMLCVFLAFRFGFIVLDRCVFEFQLTPILKRGEIANLREYSVVHQYIEMKFEQDSESFQESEKIDRLNEIISNFDSQNQK